MKDLFRGELVRLASDSPEALSEALSRWGRDSEYIRLLDTDPTQLWSAKKIKEYIEKDMEKDPPEEYFFTIHTLVDDKLIGLIGLFPIWAHGNAWVGIGLGERECWGKGYGTDAMHLGLRYAFMELNLKRVTLNVFDYNPRAIRSYEKAGFRLEGRMRQALNKDGQRWDLLEMGILREEWLDIQDDN